MKKALLLITLLASTAWADDELRGIDHNNNGVRDDYEEKLYEAEFTDDELHAALWAGRTYGRIMLTSEEANQIDADEAVDILNQLIAVEHCRRWLAKNSGKAWKDSDFYNNGARFKAKFTISAMLYKKSDREKIITPEKPCIYE